MRFVPLALALAGLVGATATTAWAEPKPAVTWVAANPNYYMRGRGGAQIRYVVIHTIEGSAGSGINTFRSGGRQVSAHYIIDRTGALTQMVKDEDTAWHAGRINRQAIGLEHAGFADRNTWTMAQYQSSARLTRWLCDTYSIPKDRQHIIGHVEAPGSTHHDPGRFFDWNLYMRLVRQDSAPEVQPLRPLSGQTVGVSDAPGVTEGGRTGLRVEWNVPEGTTQTAARVLVEEVGGALRYDSGNLPGAAESHRVTAALQHGKTYRWRARMTNGTQVSETPWAEFRTDFEGATIVAESPKDGATISTSPVLRWRYTDTDPQVSYRVWLDDDADHTQVIGDTKELNGAASSYYLVARLKPNKTYYWRAMGYDGHGNAVVTGWQRFTTSSDFVDLAGQRGPSVVAVSPKQGAVVAEGERPVLRWAYYSGSRRDQRAFRIQIDEARDTDGRILVDESYDSRATGYRALLLPPGSYRWRIKVWDGQEAKATDWQLFWVGQPRAVGMTELVGR